MKHLTEKQAEQNIVAFVRQLLGRPMSEIERAQLTVKIMQLEKATTRELRQNLGLPKEK